MVKTENASPEALANFFQIPIHSQAEEPDELEYWKTNLARYQSTIDYLKNQLGNRSLSNLKFCDLGIFPGHLALMLKRAHGVEHIDGVSLKLTTSFNERMDKEGIHLAELDLETQALPFTDDSMDVVIATEILEHFVYDIFHFLKEAKRILRPGGLFYLTTPNLARLNNRLKLLRGRTCLFPLWSEGNPFYNPNKEEAMWRHIREFTGSEVDEILKKSGFKNISIQYEIDTSEDRFLGIFKLVKYLAVKYVPDLRGRLAASASK